MIITKSTYTQYTIFDKDDEDKKITALSDTDDPNRVFIEVRNETNDLMIEITIEVNELFELVQKLKEERDLQEVI